VVDNVLEDLHLHALASLGSTRHEHPEDLLEHGLRLLVRHLVVDWAVVATRSPRGLEGLWHASGLAAARDGAELPHDPNLNFCTQVMARPMSTLVIPDACADPLWSDHPAWRGLGVRAYIGAPLWDSEQIVGVLSVQSRLVHPWRRSEVALVNAISSLFAKSLEVEALKARIWELQERLDLAHAVVEDHAMESDQTGLPNRRYLEVWCRSSLRLARRRREIIALVTWRLPQGTDRKKLLERIAALLRGVDLLVDLGRDHFLLVMPRTMQPGAEVVLARIRRVLGPWRMGATLWNPMLSPDRDAPTLQPAIHRAQAAEAALLDPGPGAADDGTTAWSLLEPTRETILGEEAEW